MRKILLAITLISFPWTSQAEDLKKLGGKLRDAVKDSSEKAQAWGEHMKDRNAEDLNEIEAWFNKTWADIKDTTDKAVKDTEAEAKRVTDTLEKDWKAYKERRKKEEAKAKVAPLKAEEKLLAGERVYTKLDIERFAEMARAESFENFVKTFETALDQESLNIEDAALVKSKENGDTPLHSLMRQAYSLEKSALRAKQLAQLQGKEAVSLEGNLPYQQCLLVISYLAETTAMGAVKNKAGKLPLDLAVDETPMSLALARHLVLHDLSNASKTRLSELFPAK